MKTYLRTTFIVAAFASTIALAQQPQGHPPPHVDIAALLNVDAAKASQVQAILDDGRKQMHALRESMGRPTDDASREKMHQAMQSIHQDTDKKLSAILTADQVAKLEASMPHPRGPGRERGTSQ
ncbi:MAG TPA: hypothetical protein VKR38_08440 [Usitatibacter sp.]|nr:hypothetical protein [Usitatibacter sp.]